MTPKYPLLISQDDFYFILDEENNSICWNERDIIETIDRFEKHYAVINIKSFNEETITIEYRFEWEDEISTRDFLWKSVEIKLPPPPEDWDDLTVLLVPLVIYKLYETYNIYIKKRGRIYSLDGFNWCKLQVTDLIGKTVHEGSTGKEGIVSEYHPSLFPEEEGFYTVQGKGIDIKKQFKLHELII